MTRDHRRNESWELSTLYLIDAACDRFEMAWRAGESPRIEAFLADWPRPDRDILFWELLAVELELRREAGENPSAGPYHSRVPEAASSISVTLRQCSTAWPGQAATLPDAPGSLVSDGDAEPDPSKTTAQRLAGRDLLAACRSTEVMPEVPDSATLTATYLTDSPGA